MKTLQLINYKCFADSGIIPFHKITIFVGENDSGKSTVFQALNLLLNNVSCSSTDFHSINSQSSSNCEIHATFAVNPCHSTQIPKDVVVNDELYIKKVFSPDISGKINVTIHMKKYIFKNEKLNTINELKAADLKEICGEFGLEYTRVEEVKDSIKQYIDTHFGDLSKEIGWQVVKWGDISEYLPSFEYYDGTSYGNPVKVIENTLISIYRSFFYDSDENGIESLKPEFKIKMNEIINIMDNNIKEKLKEKIRLLNPKIIDLSGDYRIEFSSGFQLVGINTDFGQGPRDIESIGEGSKKRFFLAITEWDKEIRTAESYKRVIRGYDEPDASLDYRAQKDIYYLLKELAEDERTNVQPVICTHSLSMIDRAQPKIINHVISENGMSHVQYLLDEGDNEIRDFIESVSGISGLSNSSLFFERCFLLVEGDTEPNALPIIYKKMTGRFLSEDGVVLVNLKGNGSWEQFLKLLNRNKSNATLLLLDSDTQRNSGSKVTKTKLSGIGFNEKFLDENVFFIGANEFEDIFSDTTICNCLNRHYPKSDESLWVDGDIKAVRSESKFSDAIKKLVNEERSKRGSGFLYKPEFGKKLAEMTDLEELNQIITLKLMIEKIDEIIK